MISDEVCIAFEISKFTLLYYRFESLFLTDSDCCMQNSFPAPCRRSDSPFFLYETRRLHPLSCSTIPTEKEAQG